jgi:hypothetical protein
LIWVFKSKNEALIALVNFRSMLNIPCIQSNYGG